MLSSDKQNSTRSFLKNQKAKKAKMGKRKSNQKKNSSTGKVESSYLNKVRIIRNKPNHQKTPVFINNSDLFDRQAFCRSFVEKKCF